MKKRFFSLFVCAALLLPVIFSAHMAWADTSSGDGDTYTDPDTGASFVVPKGWAGDAFNLEDAANFYQVKYISQRDSGSSFLYGSYDLWNNISESRRSGHTRSEIDSAYIYEEWSSIESLVNLAPEQGITIDPADVHLVTHGKNEFIEIPEMLEMAGVRIEASLFWLVQNGYVYTFMFLGTSDQATQDFYSVLSSLQVPPAEASGSDGWKPEFSSLDPAGLRIGLSLLEFFLTFLIYALPFLILRYLIRKAPVRKAVALISIIPYEIIACLPVSILWPMFAHLNANYYLLLLWGWFAYHHMVRKGDSDQMAVEPTDGTASQQTVKKDAPHTAVSTHIQNAPIASERSFDSDSLAAQQPEVYTPAPSSPAPRIPLSSAAQAPASPVRQTPPTTPRILFCRNCGFRLLDDSKFCSVCGTPVVPITKE